MSKITDTFKNKKAFIAYIMAGDPNLDKTADFILSLQDGGADIIELGIPFSDPVADGVVIQEAGIRALNNNNSLDDIFEMLNSIKEKVKIPILFMSYLNPVLKYGYDAFFSKCVNVGISGIIVPDLPFEEQNEIKDFTKKYNIDIITMIAPTSSDERIEEIAKNSKGFIYLVSSMGITGIRDKIQTDLKTLVEKIKKHTKTPVAIGFGIKTREQVQEFTKYADGTVVGTAIVKIIADNGKNSDEKIKEFVKNIIIN
jgi:tryptophan synthase alpha chain